jgi:hypothetical protein
LRTTLFDVLVEDLHQPGQVEQRSAQPIHLIDDHAIDRTGFDIDQQPLQRGTGEVGAGEAAIVIMLGQQGPALLALALAVGFSALVLRIQ